MTETPEAGAETPPTSTEAPPPGTETAPTGPGTPPPGPETPPTGTDIPPTGSRLPEDASPGERTPGTGYDESVRDIADVGAVEIITSSAVHLMSATAVKLGLAEDEDTGHYRDLDEARKLIEALAGLVVAGSPEIGGEHARALRDGLRTLQLAFAEQLPFPDPPGKAPGERYTGRVS